MFVPSTRPGAGVMSWNHPMIFACPGAYGHSLMEAKSIIYQYSPTGPNPGDSLILERAIPKTQLPMAIPGLDEARKRRKEEMGRTRKRIALEKSTQVIRTEWMPLAESVETGAVRALVVLGE